MLPRTPISALQNKGCRLLARNCSSRASEYLRHKNGSRWDMRMTGFTVAGVRCGPRWGTKSCDDVEWPDGDQTPCLAGAPFAIQWCHPQRSQMPDRENNQENTRKGRQWGPLESAEKPADKNPPKTQSSQQLSGPNPAMQCDQNRTPPNRAMRKVFAS